MTDNTTLNPGSGGDVIRDINRAGVKTQVVALDAGGEGLESLVSNTNPLPTQETSTDNTNSLQPSGGSGVRGWLSAIYTALLGNQPTQFVGSQNYLPVQDITNFNSLSSDSPHFVALTGDPSGDFAGINILEAVLDQSTGFALQVTQTNLPKTDLVGAIIESDAPQLVSFTTIGIGSFYILDTTGYDCFQFIVQNNGSYVVSASGDGITFSNIPVFNLNGTVVTTGNQLASGVGYVVPSMARYIKFTQGAAAVCRVVGYFRSTPLTTHASLSGITGNPWIQAGAASSGLLPVAGGIPHGTSAGSVLAAGLNPVTIGGVDSGTPGGANTINNAPAARRILTDNQGRLRSTAESAVTSFQTQWQLGIGPNGSVPYALSGAAPPQTPASVLNVQDTTQTDGMSFAELIQRIQSTPGGDWDGLNLLEQVIDSGTGITLNVTVANQLPTTGLLNDGSGTITLGSTAQYLFGGSIPIWFAVYNPDPTNDLWISFSTVAAANAKGSIRIAAGGNGYECPAAILPARPISIYGTSTGQVYTGLYR